MAVWGWICPLQREVELEEIDGSPAALQKTTAAGASLLFFFLQTLSIYACSPAVKTAISLPSDVSHAHS